MFDLKGRVAIVTGGNGGIGLGMARGLAAAGARIVVAARNASKSQAAVKDLAARGGEALAVETDVADERSVARLVETTRERWGRLDILINNAGINIRRPIEQLREEEWDLVRDTNLKGTWLCCRAVAEPMKRQGRGRVINVSSMLGDVGLAERTPYCSSKGGMTQLTRTLALEWAPFGITINALCPGPFATEINEP